MLNELENLKKELLSSIKKVEHYIEAIDNVKEFNVDYMKHSKHFRRTKDLVKRHQDLFSETRTVQYNAIIISLYGCYELIIKKATKIYIRFLLDNNIVSVSEKLKKDNLNSVVRMIERADNDKKCEYIKSLDLLYNQNDMSGYNYDLALVSYQNFKVSVVYNMSNQIFGINFQQILKQHPKFVEYIMQEQKFPDIPATEKFINSKANLFTEIDNLVESRNRIAHEGYEANMWSNDYIKTSIIPKLTLFVSLYLQMLQVEMLKHYKLQNKLNQIFLIHPVIKHNIICFNTNQLKITKDSYILIEKNNNSYVGKILNIEYNNTRIEKADENQNIGCEINLKVKDSDVFFIYP